MLHGIAKRAESKFYFSEDSFGRVCVIAQGVLRPYRNSKMLGYLLDTLLLVFCFVCSYTSVNNVKLLSKDLYVE